MLVELVLRCDRPGCPVLGSCTAELPQGWVELVQTFRETEVHRTVLHACPDCAEDFTYWWNRGQPPVHPVNENGAPS